ncbi:MAG: ribosome small subunit-dependent GTPase A [Muribaculaceae bacterium]|nr:ribosome small subunit-dependent GTPase A [Muribaculaceae bacterium]
MPKKRKSPASDSNVKNIETLQGRVVKNNGSAYMVELADGSLLPCRIKGNFRIKGIRTTNPVAVGDEVIITLQDSDAHYITAIKPRKNYIIRRASNLSKESHILAANIDRAILVATLSHPATPTTFIDRFLATAEAYNIPAILVLNKCDLWDDDDRELADAVRYLYDSLGYTTLYVSALDGIGIESLRELTAEGITLLAGNSGVGKSSLINSLSPEANLRTGDISSTHDTGMHTTTFSEMVTLPTGGKLIDIPGVKGFGVIDFQPQEVSHFFPEIFMTGHDCKYSDCLHRGDSPGCAVIRAVEESRIAQSRYQSYLSILDEASEDTGTDKYRKPF